MAITIMLAEDHTIMRAGLRHLIEDETDMDIVGEAESGIRAVEIAGQLKPDVIIMDVTMPDINGIEATRQIKAENPDIRIVALSAFNNPDFVLGMLKAGAQAYLLKEDLYDDLLKAIRSVMEDRCYLCPQVASIVVQEACTHDSPSPGNLNKGEIELVILLAQGHCARVIAVQQGLSIKTIEAKRRCLLKKLNIESVAHLVQYAIAKGYVTSQVS
jgi:two-component system, NarL family, response regulator NreC